MKGGISEYNTAEARCSGLGCWNKNAEIEAGIVVAGVPVTRIWANVYSFQENRNDITAPTAMPTFAIGTTTLKKAPTLEKPSTRANGSTGGKFLKKPISIHVTNGIVTVSVTIHNPVSVPASPILTKRI